MFQITAVTLVAFVALINAQAYMTPFTLCNNAASNGSFCSATFPRSSIECPSGQENYCSPNFICVVGDSGLGSVKCIPDLSKPEVKLCQDKPAHSSFCYDNMTVECDESAQIYLCPADLICKKRGYRAYCVKPEFLHSEPTGDLCKGLDLSLATSICHPLNLKRIVQCPSEIIDICPHGSMCDSEYNSSTQESNPKHACCVKNTSNLERFCSNKPVFSSFCQADGEFILCSPQPQLVQCPSLKCHQERSITARCVAV